MNLKTLFLTILLVATTSLFVSGQIIPEAFYQDSKGKLNKDQLKAAIKNAEIAAKLDTTKARFVAYQGFLHTIGQNKKVSEESIAKAKRIEPEYGRTYIFKAFWIETFMDPIENKDSIEFYLDKAVSLARDDKERAEFIHDRANALERLNILDRNALEDFETAHKEQPFNVEYTESLAKAYHRVGEFKKSNEMYGRILARDSSNFGMLNNIALNHVYLEEYEAAMNIYSSLLGRDTHDPYTNNNIGFAYFKMGKYSEASRYINRSIKNNRDNPYAYRNRAYVRIARGNRKGACKDIRKANAKGFKKDIENNMDGLKEIVCKKKDLEAAKKEIGL
jgi:tetratricopeptide (TPR) repeat protein